SGLETAVMTLDRPRPGTATSKKRPGPFDPPPPWTLDRTQAPNRALGGPLAGRAVQDARKPATATLARRLGEQGRLALDEPILRWYPAWRGDPAASVRDLLGHTAGHA